MKNVNMAINSISIQTSIGAPASPSFPPSQPGQYSEPKKVYAVSFSVQFDDEAEALKLGATLLNLVTGDNN